MNHYTTPVLRKTGARWYIEYRYLVPAQLLKAGEKQKFERFRDYGGFNRIKNLEQRRREFLIYCSQITERLENGWSPFEVGANNPVNNDIDKSIILWLDAVLVAKGAFQKKHAKHTMKSHLKAFKKFLIKNGIDSYRPEQIEKRHITAYLHSILEAGNSNRTRNNHLIDISAAFSYLQNQVEVIKKNPCIGIPSLPARSETHVTYTQREAESISNWLNEFNPFMANFCRFIVYSFFRIEEVSSLRVGDIDLEKYQIQIPAEFIKQGVPQKKPILSVFRPYIDSMELHKYPKDWYVFSHYEKPGPQRPDSQFFRDRFFKMKKEMGFSRLHTMYGLRHTFVCMLVENNTPWIDIMRLTGHTTMSAFEKYVRDIRALPARDISDKYTIKF